jgi:hypothetical protein
MATNATGTTAATKPTTLKVKLIEGAANINRAIDAVTTSGKKLQVELHRIALSCLQHADKHGDITLMQRLIEGVPAFGRKNALKTWAIHFGKFKLSEDGTLQYAKSAKTDLMAAMALPFWEFTPEPELRPFDLAKSLDRIIAEYNRHKAKPVAGEHLPDERKIKMLEEIRKTVEPLEA